VYYSRGQDITPLLAALGELRSEGLIDKSNFELRLVGRFLESVPADGQRYGVGDLVTFRDPVPHSEAIRMQATSTALLFLLWSAAGGSGWLSAKVYEYMAAGRPILAVGPPDVDAAKLVSSLRAGEVAEGKEQVAAVLRGWITEFREQGTLDVHTDQDELRRYEWPSIAADLASAFDETLAARRVTT
jgi:glycosyltransferase involved in cell wall biosynthesis